MDHGCTRRHAVGDSGGPPQSVCAYMFYDGGVLRYAFLLSGDVVGRGKREMEQGGLGQGVCIKSDGDSRLSRFPSNLLWNWWLSRNRPFLEKNLFWVTRHALLGRRHLSQQEWRALLERPGWMELLSGEKRRLERANFRTPCALLLALSLTFVASAPRALQKATRLPESESSR